MHCFVVTVNDTKMTDNLLQCLIDIVGDPVVSSAHSSFWYHQVLLPLLQVVIHRSQVVDEYTLELLRNVAHVIQALVPHLDIR